MSTSVERRAMPGFKSRAILVIDDDAMTSELVRIVLGEEGYAVETAPDSLEALNLLRHSSPALILLDITLPGMDSRAFVQAYRALPPPHAPIIVFTAADAVRAAQYTEELGATGFLLKPFDLDELVQTVNRTRQRAAVI